MKNSIIFTSLFAILLIPLSVDTVFAQQTYVINIPTGAASPDAPYFWQSEKDGSTTGDVEILVGDTINWKNADTAAHTVTSGSADEGADGMFDSGILGPGKTFSYKFTEIGDYPYYCIVHPWMDGAVFVTAGYSIIPNVGKKVGDGVTFFDVEYDFNRLLSTSTIDVEQKSLTFEIIGEAKSDNHDLELRLPTKLIDGPFVVWMDGKKVSNVEIVKDGNLNTLYIPLTSNSKLLTITGTSIVPEFGPMVMMILGISVVSMIILSQRSKMRI